MDQNAAVTRRPLSACSLDEAAKAFTEGFVGYVVPVSVRPEALALRIAREDVDADISEIFFDGGRPAGILLISRRGDRSRISALGVGPAIRSRGFGRRVMQEAMNAARSRGERQLILEVINSNTKACDLYLSLGFQITRTLVGFSRAASLAVPDVAPAEECDLGTAVDMLSRFSDTDPTWQTDPASFRQAGSPLRGMALESRAAALIDDSGEDIRFYGFAVDPAHRRQGAGRALADALAARYPGRKLYIIENVPEGQLDLFMRRIGWHKSRLTQSEMSLALS
ncbi:GNAT family N-acetyltransferase [Neorhizobium sp. S3-V5DH]|uniref:GNAT family N-acetyltransferase n=1 Tax=Neorhizobium sp. S3-V5DH TaxID=2485166 RepID=UPI00104785B9|nr:GNAT family N-acetyltransferase [Neorhizobium sp. S3-V5DH]TCV75886.1 acetyltransferase (GNAT) family protein [Neorhizobium sp. S3-V5DH]